MSTRLEYPREVCLFIDMNWYWHWHWMTLKLAPDWNTLVKSVYSLTWINIDIDIEWHWNEHQSGIPSWRVFIHWHELTLTLNDIEMSTRLEYPHEMCLFIDMNWHWHWHWMTLKWAPDWNTLVKSVYSLTWATRRKEHIGINAFCIITFQ